MKTVVKGLVLGTLLAVSGLAIAAGADPITGTWKLNVAKSKMSADQTFKSQTRVYSQSADGITLTITSVGADGKESVSKTTYKLDGKDYPLTGAAAYDALTGKQVGANTAEFTLKKGGKVVGTTRRTVSADGKTLTAVSKATDAKGATSESTLVFGKQ
jgi:hypothetical protein